MDGPHARERIRWQLYILERGPDRWGMGGWGHQPGRACRLDNRWPLGWLLAYRKLSCGHRAEIACGASQQLRDGALVFDRGLR
jgi:hypothetical protein